MNPIIKPWLELWDYLDGNFWHTCQIAGQLTSAEISWQPIPQVASLGWNLQHLAEMLDYYLSEVFRRGQRLHPELPTMIMGSQDEVDGLT